MDHVSDQANLITYMRQNTEFPYPHNLPLFRIQSYQNRENKEEQEKEQQLWIQPNHLI